MLVEFAVALESVLELQTLLLLTMGVAIGFVVGLVPGLGGPVTLALMLPFTFGMDPVQAFAFLLGMLVVTGTTGDITATLFGIPGDPTSATSVLDGYPMSRRGEAGRALGAVLLSSTLGAWVGAVTFALSIPIIQPLVLALGPPEFLMLTLIGLTFIASLSGDKIIKGLLMACVGLVVAFVGLDPVAGIPRYTFDSLYLWDGISIVPIVVGLFGGAEVLQIMLSRASIAAKGSEVGESHLAGVRRGMAEAVSHWWLIIRSSMIGIGIGAMPGVSGTVAQFVAYGHAQQTSKTPEEFGRGSMEGVVASGAVNNAKESGALIPMIGFGIPATVSTAILLSAFLVTGISPGTEMLTTRLDVTFSMVWIVVLANLLAVCLAFVVLKPLTRLTFLAGPLLVPFLLVVLTLGSFAANNSVIDVAIMAVAAAVGIACIKWNWPRIPLLLGIVLGGIAERYLFLSYSLFGWSWVTRPVVLGMWVALASVVGIPIYKSIRKRRALAERS